jgi:hypothetical protein
MCHRNILTLIFFILCNSSFSQDNYKFIIRDELDSNTISWASIYSKNNMNINCVSDLFGIAILKKKFINENDTICIESLGYLNKLIHVQNKNDTSIIYLKRSSFNLPEIVINSKNLNWRDIIENAINKISFTKAQSFESELHKEIKILKNRNLIFNFNSSGFMHDEGINIHSLLNNRNDFSWNFYNQINFDKKTNEKILDYNGNSLSADTYFEKRAIKYLLPLSLTKYTYKNLGVVKLDTINVYKIEVIPENYFLFPFIDYKLFHRFYKIIKSNKIYYINSKTFEIVQIEFNNEMKLQFKGNISNTTLYKINGVVKYYNFNNTIIPSKIYVDHFFRDNDNNEYIRTDLIYYSNIEISNLTNAQLQLKYNLKSIQGEIPNRRFFTQLINFRNTIFLQTNE